MEECKYIESINNLHSSMVRLEIETTSTSPQANPDLHSSMVRLEMMK